MTDIKIGVLTRLERGPEQALADVQALGFAACQVTCWCEELYTEETAQRLRRAARERGIEIATLWAGVPTPHVWDFVEGPSTIGLVPPASRPLGLRALKKAAEVARVAGIPSITTHVGFIPENPADPLYTGLIETLRELADHCARNGCGFCFETGQETPITLLRTIQDVGTSNLGINLDPANLLMYGKANPVDALDVFGAYVRGVHAKDGEYPSDGRHLGLEKPLGQGRVDFAALIAKLRALGFRGTLAIEREISGPQQIADIQSARVFLSRLLAE